MIEKEITLTPKDYKILCEFVGNLHNRITDEMLLNNMMGEIASISIWDKADLSISEELYGNLLIKKEVALCIKDNKLLRFKIVKRLADKGDLVYITKKSGLMPDDYIGKYYRVFDRYNEAPRILGIDTYRDGQKIYTSLHDDQYIVLEQLN